MALVLAAVVLAGTIAVCTPMFVAAMMSDAPSDDILTQIIWVGTGVVIAGLLVASHFVHVRW